MDTAKGALAYKGAVGLNLRRPILPIFLMASLVFPAITAAILWLLPVSELDADRTALAARDFTALWVAGRAAVEHRLDLLPDPALFTTSLRLLFGAGMPGQIWPYPPTSLLLAAPLSQLPLGVGFILYTVGTIALFGFACRIAGLRGPTWVIIVASPAIVENALAGQNGALTGALLILGLCLVDRRPWLAGVLLGALVIKPQLGLLLPICLLGGGRWRTLLAGGFTVMGIVSLSVLCFGTVPWVEYLGRARPEISAYMEAPWQSTSSQLIFASAFMAARSLGAAVSTAWAAQTVATLACAFTAWRLWRTPNLNAVTRMAPTIALILAGSPWVHAYDMPALAAAIALVGRTARGWKRALLGFGWFWPGASLLLALPNILVFASLASVAWIAGRQSSSASTVRS